MSTPSAAAPTDRRARPARDRPPFDAQPSVRPDKIPLCQDPQRRKQAKIPADVEFQTKPALGGDLVTRAAGSKIRRAPFRDQA